ncbi:MAG: histidinol dehydrogenase [Oscillospiraceae bacterium]|jgi:histidinol dehydrogenase|nr:histidinol dehydrogenase [Oscillospiraceae bacterium]
MNIKKIYSKDSKDFLKNLRERDTKKDKEVTEIVSEIIENVRINGDKAVKEYTQKFDGSLPEYYEVPQEVIQNALTEADTDFVEALLNAIENITNFHGNQIDNGFCVTKDNGVILGQKVRGLERVGVYVPGGKAAYPSSVLMNVIPAKIAGVKELIMVTPPLKDGTPNKDILVAAALCGVDRIFLMGGAQAVAALAYGTETVPRVDKIVGPGNIFVATAKKLLFGIVDIDMIAGPSEILILADHTAKPTFIAADMLSQAEHDPIASAILITVDESLVPLVEKELEEQTAKLSRKDIIEQSINNYGAIIICDNINTAIEISEEIAPEHLEVFLENPLEYIGRLNNAGSVFLGNYSSEPLGDYYAGPNHVLPTSGTARFFSPLGVASFYKRSSYIYYTEQALKEVSDDIILIANREQLTAHAGAIAIRNATAIRN